MLKICLRIIYSDHSQACPPFIKRNEVVHNRHCRFLHQQAGPDLSFDKLDATTTQQRSLPRTLKVKLCRATTGYLEGFQPLTAVKLVLMHC